LGGGILVGSYPVPQSQDSAKKNFSEGRIGSEKLEEAKHAVQESRVLLWEIVNAGWLHKIQYIYPQAFKLFFGTADSSGRENQSSEDDRPIKEKIVAWSNELERIDRLLLKSIEASEIQRLLEEE
jgi:hypothetical protein